MNKAASKNRNHRPSGERVSEPLAPKTLWMIMRVHMWNSLEIVLNIPLPPARMQSPDKDGSIGFIEVFDDYDKAIATAKDGDLIVPVGAKR